MKHSIVRIMILSALILLLHMGSGQRENRPAAGVFALETAPDVESAFEASFPQSDVSGQVFKTEHVWDARVTIGEMLRVGASKRGERRVIPITGGTFKGPKIEGEVLPLGEDWQLVRPDGDTELYARYLLKTNDGHLIQVINRVLMHMPSGAGKGQPYVRSVLDLEAPAGSPYEYLNHGIFLGTLTVPPSKPGEKPAVVIGVHRVL